MVGGIDGCKNDNTDGVYVILLREEIRMKCFMMVLCKGVVKLLCDVVA